MQKNFATLESKVSAFEQKLASSDVSMNPPDVATLKEQLKPDMVAEMDRQIKELESTAISIASAVDQQSVAGQDLARSIDLAARSTDEVASHIDQFRETSITTGTAASQVLNSASELEGQASALKLRVEAFLGQIRAE